MGELLKQATELRNGELISKVNGVKTVFDDIATRCNSAMALASDETMDRFIQDLYDTPSDILDDPTSKLLKAYEKFGEIEIELEVGEKRHAFQSVN